MATFFTSDCHIGHANIIRYCSRPFYSAPEMNEALLQNWNSVVTPEDAVYIIGDLSMHNNRNWLREFFERANGTKHVIKGNHDRPRKFPEGVFASVQDRLELQLGDYNLILVHDPAEASSNQMNDQLYLCGHLHSTSDRRVYRNWIDVGVDAWNYTPVHENEIIKILDRLTCKTKN